MTQSPLNAAAAQLESIESLDRPAEVAADTVRRLIGDGAAKEVLSGAWLGHALHPLLTDVPIGVWVSSVLLDWVGPQDSQPAADRLILIGLLAAGGVIATGWSDWADAEASSPAIRRSGVVHAVANAAAVNLMISSYVVRRRGLRGRGRLLSLAGTTMLGAGGWLGGHLSYTLGAGVSATLPAPAPAPAE